MGRRVAATLGCGLGPAPAWRRNIYTSIITIIISIQFFSTAETRFSVSCCGLPPRGIKLSHIRAPFNGQPHDATVIAATVCAIVATAARAIGFLAAVAITRRHSYCPFWVNLPPPPQPARELATLAC